ncbi:MAG: AAA family ATPase [Candidatus Methanomethylophilaceae archaeon]|jgi:dephospho-CoA kinase|nr:AAA family ATPase [Candidatus Methanomethylophilaceae archaeon]
MRIIVVAGMPGSGKEELLKVARSMGFDFVRMGDVVRESYAESRAESEGLSVGEFAARERERYGKDVWAERSVKRMSGDLFFVDGCRSMDEVRSFRRVSDDVLIVAIHAPRSERFRRLVNRNREDAPRDEKEFDARDNLEIGWGIAEVIALSEHMLVNDSDLETFHKNARTLLESLR